MRELLQQYMKDWQNYSFAGRGAIVTAWSNRNRVYLDEANGVLNFGLLVSESIVFNDLDFSTESPESALFEDSEIKAICLGLGIALKLLDVSCGCNFVLRRLLWCGDYWCVDTRNNSLRSFSYEKVRHCSGCGEKLPLVPSNHIFSDRFERIAG